MDVETAGRTSSTAVAGFFCRLSEISVVEIDGDASGFAFYCDWYCRIAAGGYFAGVCIL